MKYHRVSRKLRYILSTLIMISLVSIPDIARSVEGGDDSRYQSQQQFHLGSDLSRIRPSFSLTSRNLPSVTDRIDDLRLAGRGKGGWFSARYDRRNSGERITFYCQAGSRSNSLSVAAGYFIPDFGLGLIFSPVDRIYPFTSDFPLRKTRDLVKRTYFFGESLKGGAVAIRGARLSMISFAGRFGEWKGKAFESHKSELVGVRFQRTDVRSRTGLTATGSAGAVIAGFDITLLYDSARVGFELAVDKERQFSMIMGTRAKTRWGVAGWRIYSGRCDRETGLARSLRKDRMTDDRTAGFLLSLDRRRGSYPRLSLAFGGDVISAGKEMRLKDEFRVDLVCRVRGSKLRIGYTSRCTLEEDLLPIPALDSGDVVRSRSLSFLVKGAISREIDYRFSCRIPHGSRGYGRVCSLSIRLQREQFPISIDCVTTIFDVLKGNPVMYVYEPVLSGTYPWHAYRGCGSSVSIMSSLRVAGTTISVRLHKRGGDHGSADLQFLTDF